MSHSIAEMTEREKACIQMFAEMYEEGERDCQSFPDDFSLDDGITLERHEFAALMGMMGKYGVISDQGGGADGVVSFTITPVAVQIAREIDRHEKEAKQPRDVVAQLNENVRSNRVLAWVLIVFFVLMAAATFINQTISILQNLGWVAKP